MNELLYIYTGGILFTADDNTLIKDQYRHGTVPWEFRLSNDELNMETNKENSIFITEENKMKYAEYII
jgi:hypothetical protein